MSGDPRALLLKADKMLSSASSGFSLFGGRDEKYQDAADLYMQAANAFRMQKMNREAGQAFEKAARVQRDNLKDPDDAANTLLDAFKVYKSESPEDAVRCLDQAVERYCAKGNFRRAAQNKENMGEIYETGLGDMKSALDCYEKAAGWFDSDNAPALANKLWLKVADISALEEDYYKSIELYERVAAQCIDNNLMKYSVKDYFFKALCCHMATKDLVAANRALEKYRDLDPGFANTREHQLMADLIAAIEAGDQDGFTDKLFQFDQMCKLDKWRTTILVRVKNTIEEAGEDFS